MPVPAPRLSRQPTHPIYKTARPGDVAQPKPVLATLTDNLPPAMRGAASRALAQGERADALASWQQQHAARGIWEDSPFLPGAGAPAAAAVAEPVAFPHVFPSLSFALPTSYERGASAYTEDDEASDYSGAHYARGSEWSECGDDVDADMVDDAASLAIVNDYSPGPVYSVDTSYASPLDDLSPDGMQEPGSSPGPLTPFGDFVDRVVTEPEDDESFYAPSQAYEGPGCAPNCQDCLRAPAEDAKADQPSTVVTPPASDAYKRLSEAFSDFVADFVWRTCITKPGKTQTSLDYAPHPPAHLAESVRRLLWSTSLQPAAICMAMHYIYRLPVHLAPIYLAPSEDREVKFRKALLGEPDAEEREEMEAQAPFRLIVLGFMLANKWLDDHTFSNKTWSQLSGIPIQWLNTLEERALLVFRYSLSVQQDEWVSWVSELTAFHASTSPYPSPISRSASPQALIRVALDELVQACTRAPCALDCCQGGSMTEPVFIGIEERRREREAQQAAHHFDIDLDEDGPLPEEYVPRRRVKTTSLDRACRSREEPPRRSSLILDASTANRLLPPPARWSPAADELFMRRDDRRLAAPTYVQPSRTFELPLPAPLLRQPPPAPVPVAPRWAVAPAPPSLVVDTRFATYPTTYGGVRDAYGYPVPPAPTTAYGGYAVPAISPPQSAWPTAYQPFPPHGYYAPPVWGRA